MIDARDRLARANLRERLTRDNPHVADLRVVGVGAAGLAVVRRMIAEGTGGIQFIAVDTDAQALSRSLAPIRILLGESENSAPNVDSAREKVRRAAVESADVMGELSRGADLVHVVAGLAGATGTGAAPIIARLAKENGAVAIGVVSTRLDSAGPPDQEAARAGIRWIEDAADSVIVVPCGSLRQEYGWFDADGTAQYLHVNEMLSEGVRLASTMLTMPGIIGLDFNDVREVLQGSGIANMGTATGTGDNRAVEAMEGAIANRLLAAPLAQARGVLLNFTGGLDLGLYEINEAAWVLKRALDCEVPMVFAGVIDEAMGDRIRISFAATGYSSGRLWSEE